MFVLVLPPVSSRVTGFLVASPCLWGKLENLTFSNVSKQVVMLFCMADVALSDIPTCLMMFTKCQIGGSLVRNAGFSASTCLVASLSFSCVVSSHRLACMSWKAMIAARRCVATLVMLSRRLREKQNRSNDAVPLFYNRCEH